MGIYEEKSILPLLQKASFRGVEFFMEVASTTGGRKTVTHEFPNTNRRVIQDMGKKQKSFTIDAVVFGEGQDYITNRDALLNALETAGSGILVHPLYGQVTVVNDPYSIVEDLASAGRAKITIPFHVADSNIYPITTGTNKSNILSKAQTVKDASKAATTSKFKSPRIISNIRDAAGKLTDFANKIQAQADNINQYSASLSVVQTSIGAFKDSINSMMQTPAIMAANISAAFTAITSLAATPADVLSILKTLFLFGAGDSAIIENTSILQERQINRDVLNNSVNIEALANAYEIIPSLTFDTVEDINVITDLLEQQYDFLDDSVDPDAYEAIEDLRNEVRAFLDNAALTAWKIATIQSPNVPATVLSFMYYGNIEQTDTLISLNNATEPSFMKDSTEILSR